MSPGIHLPSQELAWMSIRVWKDSEAKAYLALPAVGGGLFLWYAR